MQDPRTEPGGSLSSDLHQPGRTEEDLHRGSQSSCAEGCGDRAKAISRGRHASSHEHPRPRRRAMSAVESITGHLTHTLSASESLNAPWVERGGLFWFDVPDL